MRNAMVSGVHHLPIYIVNRQCIQLGQDGSENLSTKCALQAKDILHDKHPRHLSPDVVQSMEKYSPIAVSGKKPSCNPACENGWHGKPMTYKSTNGVSELHRNSKLKANKVSPKLRSTCKRAVGSISEAKICLNFTPRCVCNQNGRNTCAICAHVYRQPACGRSWAVIHGGRQFPHASCGGKAIQTTGSAQR